MVPGNFQRPALPSYWHNGITMARLQQVRKGLFGHSPPPSLSLSLSLWDSDKNRLKYRLKTKRPINPIQPANQLTPYTFRSAIRMWWSGSVNFGTGKSNSFDYSRVKVYSAYSKCGCSLFWIFWQPPKTPYRLYGTYENLRV